MRADICQYATDSRQPSADQTIGSRQPLSLSLSSRKCQLEDWLCILDGRGGRGWIQFQRRSREVGHLFQSYFLTRKVTWVPPLPPPPLSPAVGRLAPCVRQPQPDHITDGLKCRLCILLNLSICRILTSLCPHPKSQFFWKSDLSHTLQR